MKFLLFILLFFSATAHSYNVQVSPMWNENKTAHIQISLPADKSLKSAIFQRNGYTYFIFDAEQNLSVKEDELKKMSIVRLPHTSALVLRGVLNKNLRPTFIRQGNSLFLEMRAEEQKQKRIQRFK